MNAVSICNQALDQISARGTITSIVPTDGSQNSEVCARHYLPRTDSLFRSAHWNFARMQAGLSLLKARAGTPENPDGTVTPNPPFPWLYEYATPAIPYMLKARYIVPMVTTGSGTNPPLTTGPVTILPSYGVGMNAIPFLVAGDVDANGNQIKVILTNQPAAQLVYTMRVDDPTLWDPRFVDAAVMYLAAWIASPVNGNMQQAAKCTQQAVALVNGARISDGDEGASSVDLTPDWIYARTRSSGLAIPTVTATWDALSFPGGEAY